MQQQDAIQMLTLPRMADSKSRLWLDLGCGTGTFTLALAHHLPSKSKIVAIDKDPNALHKIPDESNRVNIEKKVLDFLEKSLPYHEADGVLMANSLHYVRDKPSFILRIKKALKTHGSILIVEYDTDQSNPWIPHPLSYNRLHTLSSEMGITSIQKIHEIPSRVNRSNLYSALIQI